MTRPAHLLLLPTKLFLSVSCTGWFQESPTYEIVNDTGQTLELVALLTEDRGFELPGERDLETLGPGESSVVAIGPGKCADSLYVVRLDGEEYAREPHQMCANDEWIITGPDS